MIYRLNIMKMDANLGILNINEFSSFKAVQTSRVGEYKRLIFFFFLFPGDAKLSATRLVSQRNRLFL